MVASVDTCLMMIKEKPFPLVSALNFSFFLERVSSFPSGLI